MNNHLLKESRLSALFSIVAVVPAWLLRVPSGARSAALQFGGCFVADNVDLWAQVFA